MLTIALNVMIRIQRKSVLMQTEIHGAVIWMKRASNANAQNQSLKYGVVQILYFVRIQTFKSLLLKRNSSSKRTWGIKRQFVKQCLELQSQAT